MGSQGKGDVDSGLAPDVASEITVAPDTTLGYMGHEEGLRCRRVGSAASPDAMRSTRMVARRTKGDAAMLGDEDRA